MFMDTEDDCGPSAKVVAVRPGVGVIGVFIALEEYPGKPAGMGIRFVCLLATDPRGGDGGFDASTGSKSVVVVVGDIAATGLGVGDSRLIKSDAALPSPSLTASTARWPRSAMIGVDWDGEDCRRGRVSVR
jgi:hypothetical protein